MSLTEQCWSQPAGGNQDFWGGFPLGLTCIVQSLISTFLSSLYWIFHVQATLDAPEYESSLQAEEKVTAEYKHKNKDDDIQVKLTHFEMLMDVNPNSDLATPIGKNLQLYVYF